MRTSCSQAHAGYRDDSLETVKRNEQQYQIPLEVVSYKQLYGWTMDEIVKEIGTKNNCTFCGVFRRQALDRGATMMQASSSPPLRISHCFLPLELNFKVTARSAAVLRSHCLCDEDLLTLLLQMEAHKTCLIPQTANHLPTWWCQLYSQKGLPFTWMSRPEVAALVCEHTLWTNLLKSRRASSTCLGSASSTCVGRASSTYLGNPC